MSPVRGPGLCRENVRPRSYPDGQVAYRNIALLHELRVSDLSGYANPSFPDQVTLQMVGFLTSIWGFGLAATLRRASRSRACQRRKHALKLVALAIGGLQKVE